MDREPTELERLRVLTAAQELIGRNLRARVAGLEADLLQARLTADTNFDLWLREVPPGWRCWRIKRRWTARHDARLEVQ